MDGYDAAFAPKPTRIRTNAASLAKPGITGLPAMSKEPV
jgi:hypothetical protein